MIAKIRRGYRATTTESLAFRWKFPHGHGYDFGRVGLRSWCYDELQDTDEAGVFTAALGRPFRVSTYLAALSRRSVLITC